MSIGWLCNDFVVISQSVIRSSPSPQKLESQNNVTKKTISDGEANHNAQIHPFIFLVQAQIQQDVGSSKEAFVDINRAEAFMSFDMRVFVDEQSVQGILEQGSVMHDEPVLGHILLTDEVAGEQEESTHETSDKRVPEDEIRDQWTEKSDEWIGSD